MFKQFQKATCSLWSNKITSPWFTGNIVIMVEYLFYAYFNATENGSWFACGTGCWAVFAPGCPFGVSPSSGQKLRPLTSCLPVPCWMTAVRPPCVSVCLLSHFFFPAAAERLQYCQLQPALPSSSVPSAFLELLPEAGAGFVTRLCL